MKQKYKQHGFNFNIIIINRYHFGFVCGKIHQQNNVRLNFVLNVIFAPSSPRISVSWHVLFEAVPYRES